MVEPDDLEEQLQKIMETILSSFLELNQTDPSTILPEEIQKKAKEIMSLSQNLDKSIDQCNSLTFSKENLQKEIETQFEEKRRKLQEFSQIYEEAGFFLNNLRKLSNPFFLEKIQYEFHETLKNLNDIKAKTV